VAKNVTISDGDGTTASKVTLRVRISKKLYDEIQKICKEYDYDVGEFTREAIRRFIAYLKTKRKLYSERVTNKTSS